MSDRSLRAIGPLMPIAGLIKLARAALTGIGRAEQILPEPYGDIHARTQHPVAHILWASLWTGLAAVGWAVLSDTAPKSMVGLSGGVFNGIGNVAGIVTPLVIGYFVATTGSFHSALWFVAAHGVLGILAYVALAGRFERVEPLAKPLCAIRRGRWSGSRS